MSKIYRKNNLLHLSHSCKWKIVFDKLIDFPGYFFSKDKRMVRYVVEAAIIWKWDQFDWKLNEIFIDLEFWYSHWTAKSNQIRKVRKTRLGDDVLFVVPIEIAVLKTREYRHKLVKLVVRFKLNITVFQFQSYSTIC